MSIVIHRIQHVMSVILVALAFDLVAFMFGTTESAIVMRAAVALAAAQTGEGRGRRDRERNGRE